MAVLRKRVGSQGTFWHIEWNDPVSGRRRSKSVGRTDKKTALRIKAELERKIAMVEAGLAHEVENTRKLSDLMVRYEEYAFLTKAPTTARRDMDALKRFKSFGGDLRLDRIDKDVIETFIRHRLSTVAPSTVNVELRHLKAALNVAKSWGMLQQNPFVGVKMLKIPESNVPRFLETDQIETLRAAITRDPFRPIIEFYLLTGARLREGTQLMGEDIDFRRKLIHLRGRKTKSGRNRSIPFGRTPELEVLLREQNPRPGNPVFRSIKDSGSAMEHTTVAHHISRLFDDLGLPWATTHTLRHTFASHMVMAGIELWTVSKLLGHSSISVTEKHYAHLAPKHAEDAMGRLPYQRLDQAIQKEK